MGIHQRFNRRHRRDGTLFRGRYKAILIDTAEYLAAVVRYIHLNAVEAGVVELPEEYRWASHQYYHRAKGLPGGSCPRGNRTDWGKTSVS